MVMRKMTALLTFVLIICLLPAAAFAKTFKEGGQGLENHGHSAEAENFGICY